MGGQIEEMKEVRQREGGNKQRKRRRLGRRKPGAG